MFKLITILAAAIPVILFLKTVFFGKSKVMQQASSAFRKQVDYLVWGILAMVGCALVYSVGTLIHSFWK
jgi:amino acid permease